MAPTAPEYFSAPEPAEKLTLRLSRELAEEFISSDWADLHEDNPRIGRKLLGLLADGVDQIDVTFADSELNEYVVTQVITPGTDERRRAVEVDSVVFVCCEAIAPEEFGVLAANLNLDPLPGARSVD